MGGLSRVRSMTLAQFVFVPTDGGRGCTKGRFVPDMLPPLTSSPWRLKGDDRARRDSDGGNQCGGTQGAQRGGHIFRQIRPAHKLPGGKTDFDLVT